MNRLDETELRKALAGITAGNEKPFEICTALASSMAALMIEDEGAASALLREIGAVYDQTDSPSLRLFIENAFLFQLGNIIILSKERTHLLQLLPQNLHDILSHQMTATGP